MNIWVMRQSGLALRLCIFIVIWAKRQPQDHGPVPQYICQ
jgi:hypothetical protein